MRVFKESQRFTQWWLQLILWGMLVFVIYCFYAWYVLESAVGNVASNDTVGQLILVLCTLPVLLLFYFLRMDTTIDEIGIHYQFLPFHRSKKTIRWAELKKCYTRKYNPVVEYGGWGIRGGFGNNRAYNVKGNKGIQLVLKTGIKILIGTQKENETVKIIERYFETSSIKNQ